MTTIQTRYESQQDTHIINRYVNSIDNAKRAMDRMKGTSDSHPDRRRRVLQAELAVEERAHARNEMVRRIKMAAWNEGHDAVCDKSDDEFYCAEHANPYILEDE